MTKRLLQQLVLVSYENDKLDPGKVDEIAKRLDKKDLKAYIRALKLMEQQKKVYVALPSASVYNKSRKDLESFFPKKELVFQEDPSLLLGVRLIDNDMVYEVSLENKLKKVLDEVEQQYN